MNIRMRLSLLIAVGLVTACSEQIQGSSVTFDVDAATNNVSIADAASALDAEAPSSDPCLKCELLDGQVTCEPREVGDICESDDCCVSLARCRPCPADEGCPESGLQCVGKPQLDCDDSDACTVNAAICGVDDTCACHTEAASDGTPCTFDHLGCRVGDACLAGECVAGEPADMDDGNPCTTGVCVKGVVEQKLLGGPCSDANPCTTGDTCMLGQCVPKDLKECPDMNCLVSGWCDPTVGSCVYEVAPDGTPCDKVASCEGEAVCDAGQCALGDATVCEDDDPCTVDVCDPDLGCISTPITCPDLACQYAGICDAQSGACLYEPAPDGLLCGDAALCVNASSCSAGTCLPGSKIVCEDEDPCTLDACDDLAGCVFEPIEGCGDSFATWNPMDKQKNIVLSNSNLTATVLDQSVNDTVRATLGKASGRWYWEILVEAHEGGTYNGICVADAALWLEFAPGCSVAGWLYKRNGQSCAAGQFVGAAAPYGVGDVVGVALDADLGRIWSHVNGVWGEEPAVPGSGISLGFPDGEPIYPCINISKDDLYSGNFGQLPFAFEPPAGFSAGVF